MRMISFFGTSKTGSSLRPLRLKSSTLSLSTRQPSARTSSVFADASLACSYGLNITRNFLMMAPSRHNMSAPLADLARGAEALQRLPGSFQPLIGLPYEVDVVVLHGDRAQLLRGDGCHSGREQRLVAFHCAHVFSPQPGVLGAFFGG